VDVQAPGLGSVEALVLEVGARGSRDARSRLAFAITVLEASEELRGWS
jgi:hypothetical protein